MIWEDGERIGILAHCVLRDKLPFLNHIFIREACWGKGLGRQAILDREQEMKDPGYKMDLISTQADETAQHVYRKLGYIDCGGLMLHGTPFDQPLEIFFRKVL